MKVNKGKKDIRSLEKKMKKRNMEPNTDVETLNLVTTVGRKRKNKDKNLVERQKSEDEEQVDLQDQSDGLVEHCDSKAEEVKDSKENKDSNIGAAIKPCRSKDDKKNRRKEVPKSHEKREQDHQNECHIISSGNYDCSNGIKKWIMECRQSRPGLEVLQHHIDDFITAYEEKLEKERKVKEALAAEGGWTVVEHHKGRKKTTDSESGIAVGSVAQAAVENKLARKKPKEVGLDFYCFQKREAQRNEIMELQSKFEEDKKRLQQLRAARKFRPY
ncbi:ribosomal RNA-processing protein 7 homolog A-like [Trifolium pratense]|uniref:Uncharacterized protein n=1 Tax=Trifolium pratense TaxID=57577 RepID=A0ACB0IBL3_TRIPR|nr:ribosomal RNA-processing protein 7 homolog A-like [Trifolium pratense]CAJ2629345.1 unnamed protein product [Trifolium pratense]